jgi:hypothetical protein
MHSAARTRLSLSHWPNVLTARYARAHVARPTCRGSRPWGTAPRLAVSLKFRTSSALSTLRRDRRCTPLARSACTPMRLLSAHASHTFPFQSSASSHLSITAITQQHVHVSSITSRARSVHTHTAMPVHPDAFPFSPLHGQLAH